VVERRPLDREVRGSNPSHDIMALLLGRHYEFPQCGIIKEKNIIINYYIVIYHIQSHSLGTQWLYVYCYIHHIQSHSLGTQ
jgi:hypothetical protein